MGKFKKGFLFGALMGAGMMWMGATKKGRESRDRLLEAASDVYVDVSEKLRNSDAYKNLSKQKFVKLVSETVDRYAKDHPSLEHGKDMIVKLVSTQWKNIRQELKKRK
ncbi:YtxH domain-containing protein [Candidatus Nomurabacteria bacterium]|nr:YtxH domain-containing protein [Candidatus Nomurabacteria bacterium]